MVSKGTTILAGAIAAWLAAVGVGSTTAQESVQKAQESVQKTTTNDGVYTKAQADAAKAKYDKICAECHAFTVAAKKKPKDLPLGDEPFLEEWQGRTLGELVTLIALTMPNDGSAVVTDEEAVELIAYILQQNGFPAGSKPLTKAGTSTVIERPKK